METIEQAQTTTPPGYIALDELPVEMLQELLAKKQAEAKKNDPVALYHTELNKQLPELMADLKEASDKLAAVKLKVFTVGKHLLELKYKAYGIKPSRSKYLDEQRSHVFSNSADSITIGFNVNEGWTDDVDVGVEKISHFLQNIKTKSLLQAGDEDQKDADNINALVDLVFSLLRRNKNGNINLSAVAKLEDMVSKFNNSEFTDGVNILKASFKPVKTAWFIEASTKNGINGTENIPLSMTAVNFPADFVFEFLPPRQN